MRKMHANLPCSYLICWRFGYVNRVLNRKKTLSLLAQNQDRDAHSTDKTHQTHGAGWQAVLAYGIHLFYTSFLAMMVSPARQR